MNGPPHATRRKLSGEEREACLPWIESLFRPITRPQALPAVAARVEGMLLGLAMGDSLGKSREGRIPEPRQESRDIRDYANHVPGEPLRAGLPSDDTQLAFWTLESLLRGGYLDPADLARSFAAERIYGVGSAVRAFLRAFDGGKRPWWEAGQPSAGNGALMRIPPVVLPWLWGASDSPWQDAVIATVVTHRDEAAVTASVGFVGILSECLSKGPSAAADPLWWPITFLEYARPVETGASYESRSPHISFRGTLCDFVERFVVPGVESGMPPLEASRTWYSGAYLLETVPIALLILARHYQDAEEAIVRAVNDSKDADTVGAIVGAAAGALHGVESLPERWKKNLLGRTRANDDGHVQELIADAVSALPKEVHQGGFPVRGA